MGMDVWMWLKLYGFSDCLKRGHFMAKKVKNAQACNSVVTCHILSIILVRQCSFFTRYS